MFSTIGPLSILMDFPLHRTAEGRFNELHTPALALGLKSDATYVGQELRLSPGDILLLYTDGIPETVNAAGEQFGLERIQSALSDEASLPAPEICHNILNAVSTFRHSPNQADDASIVTVTIDAVAV
jgi:sigma-B regulation protein RsbU (phosphoserine phosphatase)